MKSLYTITIVFLALITFVACGDQSSKSAANGGKVIKKSTLVASSALDADKSVAKTGQQDEQIEVAKKLIASTNADKVKGIDAKKMFKNYCAICHGRKGNMEINGSKDLSKSKTSLEQRVAQIYFGKGTMTPFKGIIKDEEIIAVAQYIDELKK